MKLKVSIENTQISWTLKPDRKYILGSGSSSDSNMITVPPESGIMSDRHLSFAFDEIDGVWYVEDLGSIEGTYLNNSLIAREPIWQASRIKAGNVFLMAAPALVATATPYQQQPIYQPVQPPIPTVYQIPTYVDKQPTYSQPSTKKGMKVLNWKEFVEVQAGKYGNWFTRMRIRFHLGTGFRDAIWVKKSADEEKKKHDGFDAFDGYILSDFSSGQERDALIKESRIIASGIAEQLHALRKYEDTDCHVARLTDAHIVNSATQSFIGVELLPVKRAGEPDYRSFCVVSYHRVRTYLLVENYGTDLFISWITRFEPVPTSFFTILWTILAILATCIGMSANNFTAAILPGLLWSITYLALPNAMLGLGILPKRANGRLFLFIIYFVVFSVLVTNFINSNRYQDSINGGNIGAVNLFYLFAAICFVVGAMYLLKGSNGEDNKWNGRR